MTIKHIGKGGIGTLGSDLPAPMEFKDVNKGTIYFDKAEWQKHVDLLNEFEYDGKAVIDYTAMGIEVYVGKKKIAYWEKRPAHGRVFD